MHRVLERKPLDLAAFPEVEHEPGKYLVEAWLKRPGADARIPLPEKSQLALLVSYTLLAEQVPADAAWLLEVQGLGDDGKPRSARFALLEPALGMNMVRARGPGGPPSPGALYRSVFWVDLTQPLKDRLLRPGDQLSLRYGNAGTTLSLPAAPR